MAVQDFSTLSAITKLMLICTFRRFTELILFEHQLIYRCYGLNIVSHLWLMIFLLYKLYI